MARKTGKGLPAGVKRLRQRIERWRRARWGRRAMPPELWAEAIRLAEVGRTHAVARALGINSQRLKQRMQQARRRAPVAPADPFVELSGAELLGASLPAAGAVVELLDRQGERLTVRLPAGAVLDVGRLLSEFRSQGR